MSTKERAADLRRRLKLAGYNARKVSVRCDYYSMGSSIYVTIRALGVDVDFVEKIAEGAQTIHRCEMTGEILGGGNTYVHVDYSSKLREEARDSVRQEAEQAFARVSADPGLMVDVIPGLRVYLDKHSGDLYSRVRDHGEYADADGWRDGTRVYPQARCLVDVASSWFIRSLGMATELPEAPTVDLDPWAHYIATEVSHG